MARKRLRVKTNKLRWSQSRMPAGELHQTRPTLQAERLQNGSARNIGQHNEPQAWPQYGAYGTRLGPDKDLKR